MKILSSTFLMELILTMSMETKKKITLAINTATQISAVCLLKGSEILDEKTWEVRAKETEYLIPSVDKMLKDQKLEVSDIEQVVVVKGPGPFTGLRIGVVFANALAQNLDIPIFALNTFQFLNLSALEKFERIIINAGGEMVFLLDVKDLNNKVLSKSEIQNKLEIIKLSEVMNSETERKTLADLSEKQNKLIPKGLQFVEETLSLAEVVAKLIEKRELKGYSEFEVPVLPYYVKNPSITL